MIAPVFDLAAARTNTPNWPPLDGDLWADRDGREWLATISIDRNDDARIGLHHGTTSCMPSYALEKYGPLTLVSPGHDRVRFGQLPADMRARHAAYLASACWDCGPEGATGPMCRDCDALADAA